MASSSSAKSKSRHFLPCAFVGGLGQRRNAALQIPAQHDLSGAFASLARLRTTGSSSTGRVATTKRAAMPDKQCPWTRNRPATRSAPDTGGFQPDLPQAPIWRQECFQMMRLKIGNANGLCTPRRKNGFEDLPRLNKTGDRPMQKI